MSSLKENHLSVMGVCRSLDEFCSPGKVVVIVMRAVAEQLALEVVSRQVVEMLVDVVAARVVIEAEKEVERESEVTTWLLNWVSVGTV
jgi:hypothetical protein